MDQRDTPQYLKDAWNARKDTFSGNVQDARDERDQSNKSGSGEYASQAGPRNKEEKEDNEKKKNRENTSINLYISAQIQNIKEEMSWIERLIKDYKEHAAQTGQKIEENTANIHVFEGVQETLSGFDKNATYADFLKSKYGDKVFSAERGNAWEALQNPLRDAEGNPVYSDKNGELYHLQTDPETGNVIFNPEFGGAVRVYYNDKAVISGLMQRAFDPQHPEPFAEYTSKGRDPNNYRMKDLAVFVAEDKGNITPQKDAMITIHDPNTQPDSATIKAYYQVCDAARCSLIRVNLDLNEELAQTYSEIKLANQELFDKQQELLSEYKNLEKHGQLSPEQKEEYKALKQELGNEQQSLALSRNFENQAKSLQIETLTPLTNIRSMWAQNLDKTTGAYKPTEQEAAHTEKTPTIDITPE